jgi:RNA polymerase sigma-70 factor (family 1)
LNKKLKYQSDNRLIVGLKLGDRKAFEQLFNLYHKRLYFFCFSLCKNKEVAEGITQDTFIKIWTNRESINESKSFSGFLYTIAKNQVLNHIRKSLNQQNVLKYLKTQTSPLNQTEIEYSFHELKSKHDALVKKMPVKRRKIYQLNKEQGLSRKEIAEQLQISVNTVDSQLAKALKFIRSGLKEYLPAIILIIILLT